MGRYSITASGVIMAGRPPGGSADGKKRLLDACWKLLEELPIGERLTIAAVCDEARCTPPTLYHHFGDLSSLERAASRRAHTKWGEEMEEANAAISNPRKRLLNKAHSYLAWARKHPDAYHVLFAQPRKGLDPQAGGLDTPAFQSLLLDLAKLHHLSPADPAVMPLAFAFWTGLHGVASLAITMPFFPEEMQISVLEVITEAMMADSLLEAAS